MDSLYGGMPGAPFMLKKSYPSVDAAKKAIESGDSNVYYGEHLLIDSQDFTRGDLYRRTYNNIEKVGNIAGPQGLSSFILFAEEASDMSSVLEAYEKLGKDSDNIEYRSFSVVAENDKSTIIPRVVHSKEDLDEIEFSASTFIAKEGSIYQPYLAISMKIPVFCPDFAVELSDDVDSEKGVETIYDEENKVFIIRFSRDWFANAIGLKYEPRRLTDMRVTENSNIFLKWGVTLYDGQ